MLGGGGAMGVTVAALGATAALPLTIGILGGAALAGAGVSAYNKWKGKKNLKGKDWICRLYNRTMKFCLEIQK